MRAASPHLLRALLTCGLALACRYDSGFELTSRQTLLWLMGWQLASYLSEFNPVYGGADSFMATRKRWAFEGVTTGLSSRTLVSCM